MNLEGINIAIYPTSNIDNPEYDERQPIVRFIKAEDFTPEIQHLIYNNTLAGCYTDGSKMVALDIWGERHEDVLK